MSIATVLRTLLLVGGASFVALYVTSHFVHRFRHEDTRLLSFGAWLRDLFDVASGLG